MPTVAVRLRASVLPIATTGSPTWTRSESPSGSGLSERACVLIWRTATSVVGSAPITVAFSSSLPEKLTLTLRAPEMIRLFVMMCPALSITKPVPRPSASGEGYARVLIWTTPGASRR